jgi:hypothetical protein
MAFELIYAMGMAGILLMRGSAGAVDLLWD